MKILKLAICISILLSVTACTSVTPSTSTTQIVLLGDSFATGSEAVTEVNLAIQNAATSNCQAISVGGYGAGAEFNQGALVIGVPVLVECPQGTRLLPNGTPAP